MTRLTIEEFEILYGYYPHQSPSYYRGDGLGFRYDEEIVNLLFSDWFFILDYLRDRTGFIDYTYRGPFQGTPPGPFKQRFTKINFNIREITGKIWGHQGKFEFELMPTAGGGYELFINVYWNLVLHPGVSSTLTTIIDQANNAINEYWGDPSNDTRPYFELISRIDRSVIPIKPRVAQLLPGDDFYFTVNVYPDSTENLPFPFEVVHIDSFADRGIPEFSWNMRESLSFSPWRSDRDLDYKKKAGRGPHEFGHMMGIPHDIGDIHTVMSEVHDQEAPSAGSPWKYIVAENRNVPFTAHFKLAKIWATRVFEDHLGGEPDFIIVSPYESTFLE